MKLPKKIKTKWLRALRSGKYKQTQETLYNPKNKGFCCLGVLEHVCMNGKVEVYNYYPSKHYLDCPSKEFYDKFGIEVGAPLGAYICDNNVSKLMDMNDSAEKDFPTIADWIEKNIETI